MSSRDAPKFSRRCFAAAACIALAIVIACPVAASPLTDDLTELSIEELDALTISAASKRVQPLFETPAAVTVLLPVDIRRTGHAAVADALRLVPGAQVAQQMPGRWQVGVRGFSGLTSSKLLVLVDGRSVYSPFYGSVEWANADVPIEDLARVEVVRGPGATMWGANAVNGIVNVISKDARDTQGGLVALRGGTGEPFSAHVRQGGQLGESTWYRIYATGLDTDGSWGSLRNDLVANYQNHRMGLRTDTVFSERLHMTWQVEAVDRLRDHGEGRDSTYRSGTVLGRLKGRDLWGGDIQLQLYADQSRSRTESDETALVSRFPLALNENAMNLDFDFTHMLRSRGRHALIWGGGVRRMDSEVRPSLGLAIVRERDVQWVHNIFLQDEITLPAQLRLTVGTKLEHHDAIGWQPQPNVRLSWLPTTSHTVWTAVSHAVRAPSRAEREIFLQLAPLQVPGVPLPVRPELMGNPNYAEERNTAYEIGWRWRPTPRFSTDVTAYVFDYDAVRDLSSVTLFEPQPIPTVVYRYMTNNEGNAASYGAEAAWQWRPSDSWELAGGLTYGQMRDDGLAANAYQMPEFAIPTWSGHLRSWWQLSRDVEFSVAAYGTSRNRLAHLPARLRLDGQLTWHPRPDLELSLGVHRAGDPRSTDVNTGGLLPIVEERQSVYLRLRWRY